jgi:hypothetical protein
MNIGIPNEHPGNMKDNVISATSVCTTPGSPNLRIRTYTKECDDIMPSLTSGESKKGDKL